MVRCCCCEREKLEGRNNLYGCVGSHDLNTTLGTIILYMSFTIQELYIWMMVFREGNIFKNKQCILSIRETGLAWSGLGLLNMRLRHVCLGKTREPYKSKVF